jgi:hypothetical protein
VKIARTLGVTLGIALLALGGCNEVPLGPDTTPPTVNLISPSAGSTATDTIVVQVSAADNRGVVRVELYFDGTGTPAARRDAPPYVMTATLADIGSGGHTFRVVVADSAGNTATTGNVAFTAVVNPGLRFISRTLVDGSARDVDAVGGYAYVAAWDGGVVVVDVSNPLVLASVARFDTPGSTNGVTLAGSTRLLIADGVEGIRSLSISDPANPVELARLKPGGMEAFDIAVAGNYAYVAGGAGGLYAINIVNLDTLIQAGVFVSGGDVRDVEVSGSFAYTAEVDEGMRVINISRPDSMFAVDQYVSTGLRIYDVSLAVNYAYVASGDNGAQSVDVSTPSSLGTPHVFPRSGATGIFSTGSITYVSAGASGVEVINSSDPTNLRSVTGGIFVTGDFAYKLDFYANYLLVADNTQLTILKYVP